jgi:NADH-quinone oxidoreductase subunit C
MPRQIPQEQGEEIMTRLPNDIATQLAAAAPGGTEYSSSTDENDVTVAWCALANSDDLMSVAKLLLTHRARLAMISAFILPAPEEEEDEEADEEEDGAAEKTPKPTPMTFGGTPIDGTSYEIDYHFDLRGDTLTIMAYVPSGGAIDSLTLLFRTADWGEREMVENYAITLRNHPDPRRLFIDPSIDPAVLERLIPLSTLVNAASTKALWDKIAAAAGKGGVS